MTNRTDESISSSIPEEANNTEQTPQNDRGGRDAKHPDVAYSSELGLHHAPDMWENLPDTPADKELLHLRELLFTRELALLDRLRAALGEKRNTAKKVSEVLGEAFLLRPDKDPQLSSALEPLVDEILKASLRKHQVAFVDVLFPLMGPSIRKSIAEMFHSMLESFSKSMEMAFSWKGLRWRFEAWRSGKPFSEIVMLHTLIYRVEQAFFIHSETGLVLSHRINEGAGAQDADMVSAMLTAIQDFVRDCFASGARGELESLKLSEFTIYIERSSQAYLACVIRGTPPADFRTQLRSTLELMLVKFSDAIAAFNGDTAPFAYAAHYLDGLMLSRFVDEEKRLPLWAKLVPVFLVLLILGGTGAYYYKTVSFNAAMQEAINILRNEPGLMLMHVNEDTKPWQVITFKDALAAEPEEILRSHNISPDNFSFKTIPFISYEASVIKRRIAADIQLPEGVTMEFDSNGTLFLRGTAPVAWTVNAQEWVRTIPGVERVITSGMYDPKVAQIIALMQEVEGVIVEFPLGQDVPIPEDIPKLKKAVDDLVELEQLAQTMGFTATLTIYGHADSVGSEKRNYEISQARTRTVAAMLYARGSSIPITMYGMGSQYSKKGSDANPSKQGEENQASRRIELRLHLVRSVSADADPVGQYFLQQYTAP